MGGPPILLARDAFRAAVLSRDQHRCVHCGAPAQDAHHLVERRLFPDGGYYLENGAALCGSCHILAEQTVLSCATLRREAGITRVVLPEHLYDDQEIDKWGNPILPNGTRLRGDLFWDESVQKVLREGGVLHLFTDRVKYPRTYHLPWSPGVTKDDRVMSPASIDRGFYIRGPEMAHPVEVVATLKMDGENTSLYRGGLHARSIEYTPHPSRDYIKSIWARVCGDIPEGWRITGENVYARHSIEYDDLPGYFLVFGVWSDQNVCLSWDETVEWAALLGLPTVPVIYRGEYPAHGYVLNEAWAPYAGHHEGYVLRYAGPIPYGSWRFQAGKFVRANHVQTHGHWMRQQVVPNHLAAEVEGRASGGL